MYSELLKMKSMTCFPEGLEPVGTRFLYVQARNSICGRFFK